MSTTYCPDLSIDPAVIYVGEAHNRFINLGQSTYNTAVTNLDALNAIELTPLEFDVDFNFDGALTSFQRPARPTIDDAALEFRDPNIAIGPAPVFTPSPLVLDEAPALDVTAPTLVYQGRPTTPNIIAPTPPPNAQPLVMPDAPTFALPTLPTFDALNLPTVPTLTLPQFDSPRPILIEPPFNEDWAFNPEAYSETLVADLVATLRPMIVGSPALPEAIRTLLWERNNSRIEIETNRTVDQAFHDTANRGFTMPQGMTAAAVAEARQSGLNAKANASRDLTIRDFELAYEQQRFAITTGAALEGTLSQIHFEEQRYALQAAQFQRDSTVALLNYRATVFNMKLQAYQTDATVLRDRIQAELAKVEVFRAQIEAERARGEINEQRLRLFLGQWQGVQAMADFYRTRVEAVKVQADAQMAQIERFRAEVQAYSARWDAHATEWKGYIASVEGEGKRAEVYRTMVDANAKRVDVWSTSNNLKFERERLAMAQHGVRVDVWRTGLQRLEQALGAERARLAAVGQSVDAKARIYTADAQVEQAASAARDRSFELGMQRERADVDTQLQRAQMMIQQALGLTAQFVEIAKAKASVSSQLAASTMSAVSYGASLSSGRSKSSSCSTGFVFNGEVGDA